MGVYCYAYDIGLLSPTLSGLKEMLKLCEDYALKHKIFFNASNSQLLYFPSNTARVPKDFMLKMKSGQVIPYTDTCNYLGNTICSHDENVIIDNAITDMNMRLINLLSEFSHCDSGTLSTLFRTYCMNIYMGVKRGYIIATIWIICILHGERQFAEFGKYHIERIISSFI